MSISGSVTSFDFSMVGVWYRNSPVPRPPYDDAERSGLYAVRSVGRAEVGGVYDRLAGCRGPIRWHHVSQ